MTDQTYNKIELATQQLNVAISFFLKSRTFDSAWRFAAAADEILRKALSDSGKKSFEWEYQPSAITEAEDMALWMIVRACDNYELLGLPRTAKMLEFHGWFDEHVTGLGEKQFYDDMYGVDFP